MHYTSQCTEKPGPGPGLSLSRARAHSDGSVPTSTSLSRAGPGRADHYRQRVPDANSDLDLPASPTYHDSGSNGSLQCPPENHSSSAGLTQLSSEVTRHSVSGDSVVPPSGVEHPLSDPTMNAPPGKTPSCHRRRSPPPPAPRSSSIGQPGINVNSAATHGQSRPPPVFITSTSAPSTISKSPKLPKQVDPQAEGDKRKVRSCVLCTLYELT